MEDKIPSVRNEVIYSAGKTVKYKCKSKQFLFFPLQYNLSDVNFSHISRQQTVFRPLCE